MDKISIVYCDGTGRITTRTISEIRLADKQSINAYCHLRDHEASFKIIRILQASDPATGEIIPNIWAYFKVCDVFGEDMRFMEAIGSHINCLKVVKFYMLLTRGAAKREIEKMVAFVKSIIGNTTYDDATINTFIRSLWCGDIYEYKDGKTEFLDVIINAIPKNQCTIGRNAAINIASGSGRKPIDEENLRLINYLFNA